MSTEPSAYATAMMRAQRKSEPLVMRPCLRCGRLRPSTIANRLHKRCPGNDESSVRFTAAEMQKINRYLASLDRRADHALPTGQRGRGQYVRTPEILAKIRAAVRHSNALRAGRPCSPETKAKIAAGNRAHWARKRGAA